MPQSLSLKHNEALRHLTLSIAASKPFSCSWIETLLSTITAQTVNAITFKFMFGWHTSVANQLKANDWECLDRILSDVLNRGVAKKIEVYVLNGPGCEERVEVVTLALPKLSARGEGAALFGSDVECWSPGSSRYAPVIGAGAGGKRGRGV